jgi:SAM-dependent methyltransferase
MTYEKIVESFFSSKEILSYYFKSNLHVDEKKLFKKLLSIKGGNVLDLFCSAGRVSVPLAKMGYRVVGIDINKKAIEVAKFHARKEKVKNIRFVCKDASIISLRKKFDYILIMENSLEHVANREKRLKVVKKIAGHLKKNGLAIITFNPYFHPKNFVRIFVHNLFHFLDTSKWNECIILVKLPTKRAKYYKLYFHFFTPWEIHKMLKLSGLKEKCVIPSNLLDKSNNRFKSEKFYKIFWPFFYQFWIIEKR